MLVMNCSRESYANLRFRMYFAENVEPDLRIKNYNAVNSVYYRKKQHLPIMASFLRV